MEVRDVKLEHANKSKDGKQAQMVASLAGATMGAAPSFSGAFALRVCLLYLTQA